MKVDMNMEAIGGAQPYEAPRAILRHIYGQSVLQRGSFTLDDGLEEGDDDTFTELS